MRQLLRRIIADIRQGENIDLLVTVLLVFVIAILDGLGVATDRLVSSITLATLGLIAVGLLLTRYRIEEITSKTDVRDLIRFSSEKPVSLKDDLRNADEVWMLGVNMRKTTQNNYHHFTEKINCGGRIRVLISEPNDIHFEEVAARFARPGTIIGDITSHFEEVLRLYSKMKEFVDNEGMVQVKLMGFIPPYSLYIFPNKQDGGVVYVEVYGHRSDTGRSGSLPKFQVTEWENPRWYQHFVNQFKVMWKYAKNYDDSNGSLNSGNL